MKFSKELKRLRKLYGITQAKAARQIGVSIWTLRNWEQGKNEPSRRDCFPKFSDMVLDKIQAANGFMKGDFPK